MSNNFNASNDYNVLLFWSKYKLFQNPETQKIIQSQIPITVFQYFQQKAKTLKLGEIVYFFYSQLDHKPNTTKNKTSQTEKKPKSPIAKLYQQQALFIYPAPFFNNYPKSFVFDQDIFNVILIALSAFLQIQKKYPLPQIQFYHILCPEEPTLLQLLQQNATLFYNHELESNQKKQNLHPPNNIIILPTC